MTVTISKLNAYVVGQPVNTLTLSKLVAYAAILSTPQTGQVISKMNMYVVGSDTFANNLCLSNLKVTSGQNSPDPLLSVRVSDDRGYTYRELEPQSLGRQGQTDLQLSWRRTGMSRDRVIEISCTESVSLTGIFVAVTIAGT